MNLDKLLELAEDATPGPWRSLVTGSEGCSVVADAPANRIGFGRVARLTARSLDEDQANAAYIAAASPEVVAALVRVAQAAQALVSHMDGPEPRSGLWTTLKADREALRAALAEVTR